MYHNNNKNSYLLEWEDVASTHLVLLVHFEELVDVVAVVDVGELVETIKRLLQLWPYLLVLLVALEEKFGHELLHLTPVFVRAEREREREREREHSIFIHLSMSAS